MYVITTPRMEMELQKEADKAAKQLERAEKVAHMKEVKQQVKRCV